MKSLFKPTLLAALLALSAAAQAQVSVSIGQPGFYGRIDIGDAPPPRLIYAQPVIIERDRYYMDRPPLYLRVPVGYQRDWRRHCRVYNACGQRVFFVQDAWYNDQYVPHYWRRHGGPPRDMHRGPDRRDFRGGPDGHRGGPGGGHDDHRGGPGGGRDDHRGGPGGGPGGDHGGDRGGDRGGDHGGGR